MIEVSQNSFALAQKWKFYLESTSDQIWKHMNVNFWVKWNMLNSGYWNMSGIGIALDSQVALQSCSVKTIFTNHGQGSVLEPHFNKVAGLLTLNFQCIKKYQNIEL